MGQEFLDGPVRQIRLVGGVQCRRDGSLEAIVATGKFEFREEPGTGGTCLLFRPHRESKDSGTCSDSELD
jgi:hypothetical protein